MVELTDWAARVLDEVDAGGGWAVKLLVDLVRTPSASGSDAENEVQSDLAAVLRSLGLDVDHWPIELEQTLAGDGFPGVEVARSEAWGLVGALQGGGDGPSLMLNCHVDVVPPGNPAAWSSNPYSGSVEGDVLYGRGACDMKGGLAAALLALRALHRAAVPLHGDVLLACVQGEEDGGLGTFAMLQRGWRADACVIPEPTGLDVVPAAAGALSFRLRIPGHATHASRRTAGVSAIEKFWPVFAALRELERRRNTDPDPLVRRWNVPYAIEVGMVRSGDWASSVPDLLVAEGRLGVALDEPPASARREFEQAIAEVSDSDPWLRLHPVTVEWWGGQFASGRVIEDSPLVASVGRAHAAVSGRGPSTWAAPYGSDLRLMTDLGCVPTVHYGPGDVTLAHGPDESVPIPEVIMAARVLAKLALDCCGLR